MSNPSDDILTVIKQGLQKLNPKGLVERYLNSHPMEQDVYVVAIGKAAIPMMQGVFSANISIRGGLLVTKKAQQNKPLLPQYIDYIESGHPIPDEDSLRAGRLLLQRLHEWPEQGKLLFLISGGTSAMIESLSSEEITLSELQALNSFLIGSGWNILEINKIRRSVSKIKGGGLLDFLPNRDCMQLILSDVPGNDLASIGSGLLVPNEQENLILKPSMPKELRQMIKKTARAPKKNQAVMPETHVLADNDWAVGQFVQQAEKLQMQVHVHDGLCCDIQNAIDTMYREFEMGVAGLHIWGGEVTVSLPEKVGHGGRNQSLALAMALKIRGSPCLCACVATDGSDGPGKFAGAMVDGETISRGEEQGLHALECLINADAGSFLQASGDLLFTGPTGSNLMDIYMLYIEQGVA